MIVLILGGVFMLAICIFVHELGHFLMGKLVGVKAQVFSMGYGRGIWKKKVGDTTYQITAIPLGGYVKFYGDDYQNPENIPGGFLSTPPLRRIIPVLGGPLFNLLLGLVVFIILHTFSGPLAPRIFLWEEGMDEAPAYHAGLRNGDLVLSVNNESVKDYFDLQQKIVLSGGVDLDFSVRRGEEIKTIRVKPHVDEAGRAFIGIRTPGERFLEVNYPFKDIWTYRFHSIFSSEPPPRKLRAATYLHQGDVILKVGQFEPHSIKDLQAYLGTMHGQDVDITVKRETLPWLAPWFTAITVVHMPTSAEYAVILKDIIDLKYSSRVPDQEMRSYIVEHERGLSLIKINNESPGSFERMFERFNEARTTDMQIADRSYRATVKAERIGLLGFEPHSVIHREYQPNNKTIGGIFAASFKDTWDNIMIYPAFIGSLAAGRLSFIDNAMGPVGMFAVAGVVFKYGWSDYLHMMASISIALMVMNLFPFPIVDGGHIVFFLYEAVAGKPVSINIMDTVNKIGFSILMFLGLWIMYRDVIFLIGM